MEQTIEVLVEDQPGALVRVAGIITNKGANISNLTVAPDPQRPGIARILLSAEMPQRLQLRVICELNRLVQVLAAVDSSLGTSAGETIPSQPIPHGD